MTIHGWCHGNPGLTRTPSSRGPCRRLLLRTIPVALLPCLQSLLPVAAQTVEMQEIAREFHDSRAALEAWTWTARTEIRVDGEVVHASVARVHYGPEGELQATPLAPEAEEGGERHAHGPSRQERKLIRRAQDLQGIVDSYLDLGYRELLDAFAAGHAWDGRDEHVGETRIQSRNVIVQGDKLDLWAGTASRRPVLLRVLTSKQGEPVRLTTHYEELPDGPSYPALTTVETEVKEKEVVIRTETSDYAPRETP